MLDSFHFQEVPDKEGDELDIPEAETEPPEEGIVLPEVDIVLLVEHKTEFVKEIQFEEDVACCSCQLGQHLQLRHFLAGE